MTTKVETTLIDVVQDAAAAADLDGTPRLERVEEPDGQQILDAQNDDGQMTLGELVCGPNCPGRSKALQSEETRTDGGRENYDG